ncbi:MAG: hypothetical protein R2867_12165 [Caldilineaceae bacterium]
MVYDPRKGDTIAERLDLKGNPNVNEDWATDVMTKEPITFVDFAQCRGPVCQALDRNGTPAKQLKAVAQNGSRTGACSRIWPGCAPKNDAAAQPAVAVKRLNGSKAGCGTPPPKRVATVAEARLLIGSRKLHAAVAKANGGEAAKTQAPAMSSAQSAERIAQAKVLRCRQKGGRLSSGRECERSGSETVGQSNCLAIFTNHQKEYSNMYWPTRG